MLLFDWFLRWIPGTRAYKHREVDKLLAAYTAWLREATWQPVSDEELEQVLQAILSGDGTAFCKPDASEDDPLNESDLR